MKRLLLFTAILLSGCIDVDVQMDADSPKITPTETMSIYIDNFNNADTKLLNETSGSPFFWLRGAERDIYESYAGSVDFQGLRNTG